MLSCRQGSLFALVFALAISPASATEAGKLLPADTKLIFSINLRQILADHRNTDFVQRYLDQWRLALQGDETQLKKYFRSQELNKFEGISEQDFLARAKTIKAVCNTLGIDPLEEINRITLGIKAGEANDAGFFILLIEGRFTREKIKAAIPQLGRDYFGSCKIAPTADVWQVPDEAAGAFISLLNEHTLAITDGKDTMDALRLRAAGKKQDGLPKGLRSLFDHVSKEHVGVVIADADVVLNDFVRFLKGTAANSLREKAPVGKFITTQGADWLAKYADDISAAGLGLTFDEGDFRLQISVDAKKPQAAKQLHAQVLRGNFWGALGLKAFTNDLADGLAHILLRQRVSLKDTTLVTQTEVPYDFVKLAVKGTWLSLVSTDFAAAPPEAWAQAVFDAVSTRITSIPIWTLPARDKTKPLPPGTFDIKEVQDVAYQDEKADPYRHRLDMYLPKDKKDFPVLVLVHGGAWVLGDNRSAGLYSSVGQFFASQGIGVVLPNYRLSPGVKFPEHAKDVAKAVAWTHANIGKYGGDPKRLFLAGHSAGGHLAALLAADESYLRAVGMKSSDLKGVIPISGVYRIPADVMRFSFGGSGPRAFRIEQMLPFRGDSPPSLKYHLPGLPAQLNMFAPVFGDTPRECALASPVTHVRQGMPPMLILVAENDLPTIAVMADEFQQALKEKGCDVRLLKVARRNHNSVAFSMIRADDPAARAVLEFIRK